MFLFLAFFFSFNKIGVNTVGVGMKSESITVGFWLINFETAHISALLHLCILVFELNYLGAMSMSDFKELALKLPPSSSQSWLLVCNY